MSHRFEALVVRHTHRIPLPSGPAGDGSVVARQFDAALLSVGFKLSSRAFACLAGLSEGTVVDVAVRILRTVREMAGDHVRHNAYFIDFPANVPDTADFWRECVADALADDRTRASTLAQLGTGVVDLPTLPSYGRYRHSYADLLARHDELIAAAGDRVTVLHLGEPLEDEVTSLYLALAGSTTPLGEEVLDDLRDLAGHCVDGPQPESVPVREHRAVINQVRLAAGADLLLDTVTDVLRLACAVSGGDVSLQQPTRLRTLPRPVRRALLAGLDTLVAADPAKAADVHAHREMFKRLGERLHPHEYPQWPHAAGVFAVARGERTARSLDSRVEELLGRGDVTGAAAVLRSAPGRLLRALDRLLRSASSPEESDAVLAAVEEALPQVSGRVLLSVREHLHNRPRETGGQRLFVNRLGRGHVTGDTRRPVPGPARERLIAVLDAELRRRVGVADHLLIDPDVLDVALPLSGRASTGGLGVLPRGSVSAVEGELLRFFVYWKETAVSTDFDLSALLLDADYETVSWLSYTDLRGVGGRHSGDIISAPEGASEFIDLRLDTVRATCIVPQVNIYDGEDFDEVEESFFGFMLREGRQKGRPFEPRTVRMKSELRGPGRVALPLAFLRGADGRWRAKWLHLYLPGTPSQNRVEGNRLTVAALLRAIVERQQLTVGHLTELMTGDATTVDVWDGKKVPAGPVTFVGLERPDGLHPDSRVVTPGNLRDLIPA